MFTPLTVPHLLSATPTAGLGACNFGVDPFRFVSKASGLRKVTLDKRNLYLSNYFEVCTYNITRMPYCQQVFESLFVFQKTTISKQCFCAVYINNIGRRRPMFNYVNVLFLFNFLLRHLL